MESRVELRVSAIGSGADACVHHIRRDPESIEHIYMNRIELNLPQSDIFCMSSGDGVFTLGES